MRPNKRYICLDTETTGTLVKQGHKILEIGCIEIVNNRITEKVYHTFLNPEREVDKEAQAIHGITLEKVKNEPKFSNTAENFLSFIKDSILVIHNAPFDLTFLNTELELAGFPKIENEVIDTLILARKKYIGERASLDALCKKFEIDATSRTLHGALMDAKLLAEVFLKLDQAMEVHLKHINYIVENEFTRADYSAINFVTLSL
jgi:DNA polymerase-3 subunit epsilon